MAGLVVGVGYRDWVGGVFWGIRVVWVGRGDGKDFGGRGFCIR